jgi:hypothetical protein
LSLRKTNSEKYLWWSLLLFTEKIWPLIENILSTEADEAGVARYFFAKIASSGKRSEYCLQNSRVSFIFVSDTTRI